MAAPHTQVRALLALFAVLLVVSSRGPSDRLTWVLEVGPIVIVGVLVAATGARFPLTPLLYTLIGVHATILAVGGAYTYAEVPFGFWLRDLFGFERNPYDRIGHFAQGFIPAIAAREILLRCSPVARGRWLAFLVLCICLACSAFYELFEWWAALATGAAADAFLGTQGDPWDTQWDMFLALCGAACALALLGRAHDRAVRALAD